jgi:tRNA nucleotidyltransferase (CCA-adding enzyme)
MAISPKGKLIDPFDGRLDLAEGVIRCVGKAVDRTREDPLRMLRVARFASQLDFSVDSEIVRICQEKTHRILRVSKERWVQELDKLIVTEHVRVGLNFLATTRLLNFMLPELSMQVGYDQNNPHHQYTLWEHTLNVVENTPTDDVDFRWAALLHDIGKPFVRTDRPDRSNYIKHDLLGAELVDRIALYLKWSKDRHQKVRELVLDHMHPESPLRPYDMEGH